MEQFHDRNLFLVSVEKIYKEDRRDREDRVEIDETLFMKKNRICPLQALDTLDV